jgi:hypothetical protein
VTCEEEFDAGEILLAEAREGFGEEICCYAIVAFVCLCLCIVDENSTLAADVRSSEVMVSMA